MGINLKGLDIGKIMNIASIIKQGVAVVQQLHGDASGAEKHAAVVQLAKDALPAIEGAVGKDIADDATCNAAVDAVVVAEKAVINATKAADDARKHLMAVVADIKAKHAA